jgi:hypothetical protein
MKNLEIMELTTQELEEVNGGGWFSDALDWIGGVAASVWDWMVEHGNRDGSMGFTI